MALFNPRAERWTEHFQLIDALVVPLTAIGRATAFLLRLNDPERVTIRANLLSWGATRRCSRKWSPVDAPSNRS